MGETKAEGSKTAHYGPVVSFTRTVFLRSLVLKFGERPRMKGEKNTGREFIMVFTQ